MNKQQEEHVIDAYCKTLDPFKQSALRCMRRGEIAYDKKFCDKIINAKQPLPAPPAAIEGDV